MNCYIHVLPGRMRIRTDLLKKNELAAYALRRELDSIEGVYSVFTNTVTGSILIRFEKTLDKIKERILIQVAQQKLIPLLDFKVLESSPGEITRVYIETQQSREKNLWPLLLKRSTQCLLGSIEWQPSFLNIAMGVLIPAIVDVIGT